MIQTRAGSPANAGFGGFGAASGDGLPPLHVPLRFFVTAALFGVAAGVALLSTGNMALVSRWTPALLGTTHLLTLGFFVMVTFGALFQVVPVLGGGALPQARLVANVVHPGLCVGTICLATGLWSAGRGWMLAAVLALSPTFAVFVVAVGSCLLRQRAPALRPLRLAIVALVAAIALGFLMATAMVAPGLGIAWRAWTDLHASWGGLGFGLLLVIGVSLQVVPMFHVTPPFDRITTRVVPPLFAVGLGLQIAPVSWLAVVGAWLHPVAGLWWVVAALRLLMRRRRRRPDATVLGWQIGLAAIGATLVVLLAEQALPTALRPSSCWPGIELPLALLFGLGGLGTIVLGMLTKIVPFLAFLHLQCACVAAPAVAMSLPPMERFVDRRVAFGQVVLHGLAVACLVGGAFVPALAAVAGVAIVLDFAWAAGWLCLAWGRYGDSRDRVLDRVSAVGAPAPGPH